MKRKAIALTTALLLLGSTPAWGAPVADNPFLGKYDNKVSEYIDSQAYANIVVSEEVKVNGSNTQFSITPFSAVLKGQRVTPKIFYSIFKAKTADSIQFVVLDPDEKVVQSSDAIKVNDSDLIGIISLSPIFFEKIGDYKIQLLLNGEKRIGQTIIKSSLPK